MESRDKIRSCLIDRIGPWAFQSFSRNKWHQVSDDDIIEGALANAPESDKLRLLDLYSLSQIIKVWRAKVLIQDDFKHASNVWIANHIFKQKSPEKFVEIAYQQLSKQHSRHAGYGRAISRG